MITILRDKPLDRKALTEYADWLAVAVAVSFPWSTTATGILIALWLVTVLPTFESEAIRRELMTAAGGLPVLLWLVAVLGMLWADATWSERLNGIGVFNRLLVIPLLLARYRRSEHGFRVLYGFFAATAALLLVSWILVLCPGLPWRGKTFGVPVKDYILQSVEFLICAFALLGFALQSGRFHRWRPASKFLLLATLFLVNIFFIATSRTAVLVIIVLSLVLGWRQFRWKGLAGAVLLGCLIGAALAAGSPYLRERLGGTIDEIRAYRVSSAFNSTGLHIEFLRKSLSFIGTAPVAGHGTGSVEEQFRKAAIGQTGDAAQVTVNPHNQMLAVAIQLGLIGAIILAAMWAAHVMLFVGGGPNSWIGLVIVVQNVVSSLFNSHLFDFTEGWIYVFGVGVVGGMVLRERDLARAAHPMTRL